MTQFNLADELRRGGTGLLAQAVAELVKDELAGDVIDMIEFLAEMERRAAAVPAGNQAKAPTALDEMHALQEGAQRNGPLRQAAQQLRESREALARVEAERDELAGERDRWRMHFETASDNFTGAKRALARTEAVIEAAQLVAMLDDTEVHDPHRRMLTLRSRLFALDQAASGPECAQKGHAYATNKGECCIYCFRPKAECLHMGEPASEAEVVERTTPAETYAAWRSRPVTDWELCTCPKNKPSSPTRPGSAIVVGHGPWCPYVAARCKADLELVAAHKAAGGAIDWAGEPVDPEATESATKEAT